MHSILEAITPLLKESNFRETGRLTPEEFTVAGDYLVFKCPTWSWCSGDPSKLRPYLPADKQFLVTKAVSCGRRVRQMRELREDEAAVGGGWTDTAERCSDHVADMSPVSERSSSIHDSCSSNPATSTCRRMSNDGDDDKDIPDMETFEDTDNVIRFVDPEEFKPSASAAGNVVRTRTYDLSITYDKYYQTPRLWLCGYDETGQALDPSQVFEDISQEHARKTVTIESHPHLPDLCIASIHPCKHANVMRSIVKYMRENGTRKDGTHVRVDRYLVLFLKFMGCVLPTIEYDHTMSV